MLDLIVDLAQIVSVGLAGLAVLVGLRGVRDQLFVQTFVEYTARFTDVLADLYEASDGAGPACRLADLPDTKRSAVLNVMRRYFNLCAQEKYLHGRRLIDAETWTLWRRRMGELVGTPLGSESWRLLRAEYVYFKAFTEFVDDLTTAPAPNAGAAGLSRPSDGSG